MPVALSTDDEGVSRIDLTHEYVRAVEEFGLGYRDLKQLVRNSVEYSFLPGASLGEGPGRAARAASCAADVPGGAPPSAACTIYLGASERATQQWRVEERFAAFERRF